MSKDLVEQLKFFNGKKVKMDFIKRYKEQLPVEAARMLIEDMKGK